MEMIRCAGQEPWCGRPRGWSIEARGGPAGRWWAIPPPALRRRFFRILVLVLIAVLILASAALYVVVPGCLGIHACDTAWTWALVLPFWWPSFLGGMSPTSWRMGLAPAWWLALAWILARAAIVLWPRDA